MADEISIYYTRFLMAAAEELKEPQTYFLKTFFPGAPMEHDVKYVDVDVFKGKRRVATYVNRRAQGQNVERIAFKTVSYVPPYLKPKMTLDIDNTLRRSIGQNNYSGSTARQRAEYIIGRDLKNLDDMITRAEEIQAMQAIMTGKIQIKNVDGNNLEDELDFGRDAELMVTLTGTDKWTNAASDPIEDCRAYRRLIQQKSGFHAKYILAGSNVVKAFMTNTNVKAYFNLYHGSPESNLVLTEEAGQVGANFIAQFEGFRMYSYDDFWLDYSDLDTNGDPTEKPVVDPDSVLIAAQDADTCRCYGVIEDVDNPVASARFPKMWIQEDPSARFLQLHSAPLMVTNHPDAYAVLKAV